MRTFGVNGIIAVMPYKRTFGHVADTPKGATFNDREEVRIAGLHAHQQNGISGTRDQGADAIVLHGGYIDDDDRGVEILYTGHGGRDSHGHQVKDQDLNDQGNAGLVKSQLEGYPVRVIRGYKGDPEHAPKSGYRYDGLYQVEDHWFANHKDNEDIRVCMFRLVEIEYQEGQHTPDLDAASDAAQPAPRQQTTVQQIIRNPEVAHKVKKLHNNKCQVCGTQIMLGIGAFSNAAHIRALGSPHNGPDVIENVLCLCPNDHIRFDNGALLLTDSLEIIDTIENKKMGTLRTNPKHKIDISHVQQHRQRWVSNKPASETQ